MLKLRMEIKYQMYNTHPDYLTVPKENRRKSQTFSDIYTYNLLEKGDEEWAVLFAKRDLAYVAGGGYRTDTIYNVRYRWEFLA